MTAARKSLLAVKLRAHHTSDSECIVATSYRAEVNSFRRDGQKSREPSSYQAARAYDVGQGCSAGCSKDMENIRIDNDPMPRLVPDAAWSQLFQAFKAPMSIEPGYESTRLLNY